MEYFNYLNQETESIDTALDFYFVRNDENDQGPYRFIISPQIAELLARDAITNLEQFYRVSRQWVINHHKMLFLDFELITVPWTLDKLKQIFASNYQEEKWKKFSSMRHIQLPMMQQIKMLIEPSTSQRTKKFFLSCLIELCKHAKQIRCFSALGGIDMLVGILDPRNGAVLIFHSIKFLERISVYDFVQHTLYQRAYTNCLLKLLGRSTNPNVQKSIIGILLSISTLKKNHKLICKSPYFASAISMVENLNEKNLSALLILFHLFCMREENHSDLIAEGIVDIFLKILSNDFNTELKKTALDSLLHLANGYRGRIKILNENGFLVLMLLMHKYNSPEIKSKAWQLLQSISVSNENIIMLIALNLCFFACPKNLMQIPLGPFFVGAISMSLILLGRYLHFVFESSETTHKIFFRTIRQNVLMFPMPIAKLSSPDAVNNNTNSI